MNNFNYKRELLLFLYENNSGYVEIYPVSENDIVTDNTISATIINLKKDLLIESDAKHIQIGSGDPKRPETVKSLGVKARITALGEQYVRDSYLAQHSNPTINASQVVYANGDINAPISQANDHSESNASQSIAIDKKKRATAIQIIKNLVLIISAVASAIAIYEFVIK